MGTISNSSCIPFLLTLLRGVDLKYRFNYRSLLDRFENVLKEYHLRLEGHARKKEAKETAWINSCDAIFATIQSSGPNTSDVKKYFRQQMGKMGAHYKKWLHRKEKILV